VRSPPVEKIPAPKWAGRGRRIVGLHVARSVCNETQAQALLQKALDAVP
jgi:hypothetical protein